jgi:phosphoribosylamine--glycine ligase
VSLADDYLSVDVAERILKPTLAALDARGRRFTGLLYAGLMLTADGPRVVEFNCRFGDPETQAVLPVSKLSVPFVELLAAIARGERLPAGVTCSASGAAVTTVLAAKGYPEHPTTGDFITVPQPLENTLVFHAGTSRAPNGALVTSGGRVLGVTGIGASLEDARAHSLDAAKRIDFDGKQFRTDIGWRELARGARAS